MKKLLTLAALLVVGAVLQAGPAPSGWMTDFVSAQRNAQEGNRPMLLLFTGSDWCGWCIKLHKDVLSKPAFKRFAVSKKLLLVYLDFPRGPQPEELKAQNRELARKFNVRGYPTTIVLAPDGRELGRMPGYAKDYINRLNKILREQ